MTRKKLLYIAGLIAGIASLFIVLGVRPLSVVAASALLAVGEALRLRGRLAKWRAAQRCSLGYSIHATSRADRWVCCRCRQRYDDGDAAGVVPDDLEADILTGDPIAGVSLSLECCSRWSHACCDGHTLRYLRALGDQADLGGVDLWGVDVDLHSLPGDDGRPLGTLIGEILDQARMMWLRESLSTAALCGTIVSQELAGRAVAELAGTDPFSRWPGRTSRDIERALEAAADTLRELAVYEAAEIGVEALKQAGEQSRGERQR